MTTQNATTNTEKTIFLKDKYDIENVVDLNDAKPRRLGWLLLVFGFGGFLLWATFAPLDQGVSSPGTVVVSGNRKTIQPLTGGKITELLVRDGDNVKAGQVLLRLDSTQAQSQLEIARSQWYSALAVGSRLAAERAGKSSITFPDALLKEKADPHAAESMILQAQLFQTRRRNLEVQLDILAENMTGLEAQAKGLDESLKSKQEQLRTINEQLVGQRDLAKEGYLPRNRLLEQERLLAQLNGSISEDIGNIGRSRSGVAEMKARMLSQRQDYQREVETLLTETQKDAAGLESRVEALSFDVANTEIKSPVDGIVVGLTVHTVGGVVGAGTALMDVVPNDEPLRIDSQIPTHLIDKMKAGLPVEILFPAFKQATTPQVPGTVLTISADVLIDPKQGVPYYKAQVEVTPEGMKMLRQHQIKAGMPAEIFVKTGERTMLSYLFKPLIDRLHSSLTED